MVVILSVDTEIEAELARGMLESAGIAAQVRFSPKVAYGSYAIGSTALGAGAVGATYDVLVREVDLEEARRVLGERAPRPESGDAARRLAARIVAAVMIVSLIVPLLVTAIQRLRLLF